MNIELRKAKEECGKAYEEYTKANQAVCDALGKEEKNEAIRKLKTALEKFNKAQRNVDNLLNQKNQS